MLNKEFALREAEGQSKKSSNDELGFHVLKSRVLSNRVAEDVVNNNFGVGVLIDSHAIFYSQGLPLSTYVEHHADKDFGTVNGAKWHDAKGVHLGSRASKS